MRRKTLISVVIPVYNDEQLLLPCLESIARLNRVPDEVIVVDNNSTDSSREVAAGFPFVKIIEAKDQGVVYARTIGFDAASGDIIARIDSDSILPPDWLDQIEELFASDPELAAVSGSMIYHDIYLCTLAHRLDRVARRFLAKHMSERIFLHGSNMALKKSSWENVKSLLCVENGIHEDLDLAIHLQEIELKVIYAEELVAKISSRRIGTGLMDLISYCLATPKTYAHHKLWCRVYIYPVIITLWLLYPIGHFAYLGFDAENNKLSFTSYLANRLRDSRIDPSTNVA